MFFNTLAQKFPTKAFLVTNLGIFVFRKILQSDKFEDADFKYDNSIFKILAQKYPNKAFFDQKYSNKAFFVPNLKIFVSSQNFAIR